MTTLAEIKARFDAIIPGPWRWMGNTATDQVYLGTTDRGRLYIMDTHTRVEQRVFHHDWMEGYSLEEARVRVKDFCGAHDSGLESDDRYGLARACRCEDIRAFLVGEIDAGEDSRHLDQPYMSRAAIVRPDLRFPDKSLGERRPQHGGMMRSYRGMAKYEVLGYRSTIEWETDQGGVIPSAGHDIKDHLYREDFCGLDHPEATFIEHAAEDIPWLLGEIERLGGLLDTMDGVQEKGWWRDAE